MSRPNRIKPFLCTRGKIRVVQKLHAIPCFFFFSGIICGPPWGSFVVLGSFSAQFGDHSQLGIICGVVLMNIVVKKQSWNKRGACMAKILPLFKGKWSLKLSSKNCFSHNFIFLYRKFPSAHSLPRPVWKKSYVGGKISIILYPGNKMSTSIFAIWHRLTSVKTSIFFQAVFQPSLKWS